MGKKRNHDTDDEDEDSSSLTDNRTKISLDTHQKKKKKEKLKIPKANGEEWSDEENIPRKELITEEGLDSGDAGGLAWTEEEMRTLVQKIESQLPKEDNLPYSRRIYKLDWDKVSFDPYNAENCKKKFQEILSKQRTFRLLPEILQEVKEWVKKPWTNNSNIKPKRHPDMPPQPLSSYMIFSMEKKKKLLKKHPNLSVTECAKILGELFNSLPEDKKEKYKLKALKLREEYNVKLKEFFDKHPDALAEKKKQSHQKKGVVQVGPTRPLPPFKLFCESKIDKHKNDPDFDPKKMLVKCKEQWKKLSDKKKAVWIKWTLEREQEYLVELSKYVAEHPDFDTSKIKQSILTKEERAILDRIAGKPKKPPNSAYSYFCSINMMNDSYHNGQIKLKDLAERWKALSEAEKKLYAEKIKMLQEKYKEDFASYLNTLPEEKRIEELQNLEKQSHRRKPKIEKQKNQQHSITKWIEKKKEESADTNLYKNEPPQPPGTAFDYFMKKFGERHPDLSDDELLACAKLKWERLSNEKKNRYKDELQELKNRFIKEFATFLKNLNEKELAEYSVLRNRQLKSDSEESDGSISSDGNDDDDSDNGGNNDNIQKKPVLSSSSNEEEDNSD